MKASILAAMAVAATAVPAGASGCTWEGAKITNRQNTSCAAAQRALKVYYGGGGTSPYKCRATAESGYMAGRCKNGPNRSFRFSPS